MYNYIFSSSLDAPSRWNELFLRAYPSAGRFSVRGQFYRPEAGKLAWFLSGEKQADKLAWGRLGGQFRGRLPEADWEASSEADSWQASSEADLLEASLEKPIH